MPVNRLIVVGFILVLAGAVIPFLIVLGFVESTFLLNFLAYGASVLGIFLGVIGVATYVGEKRRKDEDDWYEE